MNMKAYYIIMGYFGEKDMNREQIEEIIDFDNLTMEEPFNKELTGLLKISDIKTKAESEIKRFCYLIKERSGSGIITWEEFVNRLEETDFGYSLFGIRAQMFSKMAYWEIWFNHYDLTEFEDGDSRLEFNHTYYEEVCKDDAYTNLWRFDVNTDVDMDKVIIQIADIWDDLSENDRADLISAIYTITPHDEYVNKSRLMLCKSKVQEISMTNADLVLNGGLRDYTITFTDGDRISLRF